MSTSNPGTGVQILAFKYYSCVLTCSVTHSAIISLCSHSTSSPLWLSSAPELDPGVPGPGCSDCCLLATLNTRHGPGLEMVLVSSAQSALKMSRRPPGPTNVDTRSLIAEGKPVLRPRTELRSSWAASLGSISEWRGASSMQSATQSIFGHIWVV